MTVTRRNALIAGVAGLPAAALLLGSVKGQPPGQPGQPGRLPLGEDPLLAACLLNCGRRQIEVCGFAKDRCQSEDVKAFAQAEIDEHEKVKADLAKFGYQPPTPGGSAAQPSGQPVQQAGAVVPQGNTISVGRVFLTPGVSQFVTIESEVVDTCIANAKQRLTKCEQEKGKHKLEKAFIGDQLHEHYGLLDKVTVFKKHATPEILPVLDQGEQIIRQHIATCERLKEKLMAMKDDRGADRRNDDK